MAQRMVIDGFEGDLARVEWEGHVLDVPRAWLPNEAREGDHLQVEADGEGSVRLSVDVRATRDARERHQAALDALNSRAPQGDIDL